MIFHSTTLPGMLWLGSIQTRGADLAHRGRMARVLRQADSTYARLATWLGAN